jgi:23S rRNA pseudouridine1911/1915/1917 synthase
MSSARKAVRRGEIVRIHEGITTTCNTSNVVLGGETFHVQKRLLPGLFPQGAVPFEMTVVYEDDHIAAVIKPPGIVTTKNKGQNGKLAAKTGLAYCLTPTKDVVDPLWRPVPAHRLDSATGGLLLAAKTRRAIVDLTRQFVERRVRKRYVALVAGRPAGDDGAGRGRIEAPLSGQDAVTDYEVTESVRSLKYGWVSAVSLRPQTGRTHQVPCRPPPAPRAGQHAGRAPPRRRFTGLMTAWRAARGARRVRSCGGTCR